MGKKDMYEKGREEANQPIKAKGGTKSINETKRETTAFYLSGRGWNTTSTHLPRPRIIGPITTI